MQKTTNNTRTRSIVVAGIDLAERSQDVLEAAAKLVTLASEGELHAVHVIPGDAVGSLSGENVLRLSNLTDEIRADLEQLTAKLAATVTRVVLHVRIGAADHEIAQLASDLGADFIVVGTHDHRGLERLILGSVGASLVRNAPCPVLVCRPKTAPKWAQIEPPCPDCVAVQERTERQSLWCERHSQHRPRAHTYSEIPPSFGVGAQTFR